jgi:hypothetical protein
MEFKIKRKENDKKKGKRKGKEIKKMLQGNK